MLRILPVALFSIVYYIDAYPTGAPSQACQTMTPSHNNTAPQSRAIPYTVAVNPTTYTSGSVVTITLSSPVQRMFKGYLMEMRRSDNDAVVGTFSVNTGGKLLTCNNNAAGAVTHTENGDKTSVTFNWRAPAESVGQVRVVATVVQSFDTFWTNIQSRSVTEQTTTTTTENNGGTTVTNSTLGQNPSSTASYSKTNFAVFVFLLVLKMFM